MRAFLAFILAEAVALVNSAVLPPRQAPVVDYKTIVGGRRPSGSQCFERLWPGSVERSPASTATMPPCTCTMCWDPMVTARPSYYPYFDVNKPYVCLPFCHCQ
ncbi:hypothetical protein V8F20_001606 [Naviculisporaceae sp. PSN 640]